METIRWREDAPEILDQTLLPGRAEMRRIDSVDGMCEAICALRVRGAPLIGVSAAYALALAAQQAPESEFECAMERAAEQLRATRPTAVNLFWAIGRTLAAVNAALAAGGVAAARQEALAVAERLKREDIETNRALGAHGSALLADGSRVLTHCNAGALATCGHGTALGVIRSAVEAGKRISVYADETRPLLQGARLTAWELMEAGIPVTLLTDGMSASLMAAGQVDAVVVGADRIAANGDAANKIGTSLVALAAHFYGVPFYVAAPLSTVDRALASGRHIPIEHRAPEEVTGFQTVRWAPAGVKVYNPAFDVTDARLIAGIITERGVLRPPYGPAIARAFEGL